MSVEPSLLTVNQTDTANFTCMIFGIPTPTFVWTNGTDTTPLFNIPGIVTITNVTDGYNITSSLTIISTERTDMNVYTCTAMNGIENLIESPESDSGTLSVQGKLF